MLLLMKINHNNHVLTTNDIWLHLLIVICLIILLLAELGYYVPLLIKTNHNDHILAASDIGCIF